MTVVVVVLYLVLIKGGEHHLKIYDGRDKFYQWDYNQKIITSNLKVGDEIHFFDRNQTNALVVLAYEFNGAIVADVPNILLTKSSPIKAYRVVRDETCGRTIEEHTFMVKRREKPVDYVYTETEVLNYGSLEKRVSALEKNGSSGGSSGGSCDCPDNVEVKSNRVTRIDIDTNNNVDHEHYPTTKAVSDLVTNYLNELFTLFGDVDDLETDNKIIVDAINELNNKLHNMGIELNNILGNIDGSLDSIIATQQDYIAQSPLPMNEGGSE